MSTHQITKTKLDAVREFEARAAEKISPKDRPLFHLTPLVGWMNDPNGFCFFDGQYHLFYQYHPYKRVWGPMHWGHATSKDLIHWQHQPAALAPDTEADEGGCFSGSAVPISDDALLLMYTGVQMGTEEMPGAQTQCIAVGDGFDFVKSEANPVLTVEDLPKGYSALDFRDPKIWKEADGLYCVAANRHKKDLGSVLLFHSADGVKWQYVTTLDASRGEMGKMWECPDFFTLDGKQVLIASPQEVLPTDDGEYHAGDNTIAIIGSYDKKTHKFTRESVQPLDYGLNFYAPQTTLSPDGRRIMIAWMENWTTCKDAKRRNAWFGSMSTPRELQVIDGHLYQTPVREIENLWQDTIEYKNISVKKELSLTAIKGRALDISAEILTDGTSAKNVSLQVAQGQGLYTEICVDLKAETLTFDRTHCGSRRDIPHMRTVKIAPKGGKLKLRILLDGNHIELFLNDGEKAVSSLIDAPPEADGASISADAPVTVSITAHHLA